MKPFKLDKILKHALALLLLVGMTGFASAQRTISGTITDAGSGETLIGANILVVGTSTGTVTDFDGKYSLNVPEGSTEIEISYTGYTTQRITLGASNTVDIALAAGELLDEIVVVGYGSVKKSDATGAVTALTSEDFNVGIINSPEQLIQGRAAGVQITSASGEPGAGVNVRIRGTSSVRSNNNPLFVVDGVPLAGGDAASGGSDAGFGTSAPRNPLNFLNPSDIASIDILKDASATAIYGSRGANGVVIITTKKGSDGKGRLNYDYSLGISNITQKYDLLGADDYLAAYADLNGQAAADLLDGGADTDWQDEIFRTALTHTHSVSYGGGDESGNYLFSFSYMDQEGIIDESGLTRYTGRFNGTKKFINDRLRIGTQLTVATTRDDNIPISDNAGFEGDLLGSALKANPTLPVYDEDGETPLQPSPSEPNPRAYLLYSEDYTNTLRALGSFYAELEIVDGLTFRSSIGFDQSVSDRTAAFSSDLNFGGINDQGGRLYLNDVDVNNRLWENYFTYDKAFGSTNFNAVLGYSFQEFNTVTRGYEFTNFRTNDLTLMINNFAAADQSTNSVVARNSTNPVDQLQSYFGRINLGFADSKYLLTATLRADGSTRFGEGNKYGYFPSAAFKWRLIEEDFIPDVFDDLGLRVGYGITGNQELPYFVYGNRFRYSDWDIDRGGGVVGGAFTAQSTPNPDLKWETTSQINVGIDFAFWNTRLSGTLDWYRKNTNDLLVRQDAAQPAATPFVWTNLDADILNTGVELGLTLVAVDNGDFSWDINGNVAFNRNEVTRLSTLLNTGDIDGQGLTGAFAQRIAEGQPLFAFFLREFGGYDEEGITIYPEGDVQQFVDASPLPTVNAGLTNFFTYKGLDVSIFFTGQFGHYIYSNTANAFFTAGALAAGRNVTSDVVGNGESRGNAPDVSTRFLEKGDFVRLQNASIGYRIPTGDSFIRGLRISVSGQNLLTFTNYSGQDPEVNVNKALDEVPSLGIDYTPYPRARTILLGVNVSF